MKKGIIKYILIFAVTAAVGLALLLRHQPAAKSNEEICAFASAHEISVSAYPDDLVALLERNPETRDFVLNYPLLKNSESEYEFSLPEDGLLLQWDERWGYQKYSGEILGLSGCGPTALSMAAMKLMSENSADNELLKEYTPDKIAEFSTKNKYTSHGNGTSWKLMSEGAERLGLCSREIPLWEQSMADALESGSVIICAMGKGDFTSTGHFIVLTDYENGEFSVLDPNSRARSQRNWSYAELEGQIKGIWGLSLPETETESE